MCLKKLVFTVCCLLLKYTVFGQFRVSRVSFHHDGTNVVRKQLLTQHVKMNHRIKSSKVWEEGGNTIFAWHVEFGHSHVLSHPFFNDLSLDHAIGAAAIVKHSLPKMFGIWKSACCSRKNKNLPRKPVAVCQMQVQASRRRMLWKHGELSLSLR